MLSYTRQLTVCDHCGLNVIISIYNIHNSNIRPIDNKTAEDEMMVHLNGPEIGEVDETLASALDKHFKGHSWHFTIQGNLLRSAGLNVEKELKKKSKLPFYSSNK